MNEQLKKDIPDWEREYNAMDVPRTKRRPPVKLIEVKCHACGSTEMINPAYKSGTFHRCGRCVG